MIQLLNSIVDANGNCLIDGLRADVAPVSEEECTWLRAINFTPDRINRYFSSGDVLTQEKVIEDLQ